MSPPFRLVALLSSYREGTLIREAIISCFRAELDAVVIWEGPAGVGRCDDAPPTERPPDDGKKIFVREGEWETDAEKRTAMIRWTRERWHDCPLWVLWIDGDEVLVNGRYLRDIIQRQMWEDEARGASILLKEHPPSGGIPMRQVDADGSVALARGRLVRGDFIRRYVVSNLIIETVTGVQLRLGNVPESTEAWVKPRLEVHGSNFFMTPPLPCEPFTVHRSHLRHPAREQLRLHTAEHDELERLGLPTGVA